MESKMEDLKKMVETHHDPSLVKPDESPNANIQTLIFNDGEIISTKGGWSFMKRSLFPHKGPMVNCRDSIMFPIAHDGNGLSYAIVKDLETAESIRDAMVKVFT